MSDEYALLLARIRAIEQELAALREELEELKDKMDGEPWLGGTD